MRPGLDLRLVPAALAAWAGALVVVVTPAGAARALGWWAAAAAALIGAAAAVLARRPDRGCRCAAARALGQALLLLLTLAAVSASGAAQLAARESGLLAALVRDGAAARLVGTVRSDPVPVASATGWGAARQRYRFELAAEQVRGRGRAGPAAARVLVLAGPEWARVRFGARVEATGRLAPAARGESMLGLLAARGGPRLVSRPGVIDRIVGSVRTALLGATDHLGPDPRGLVPGIAVGDTSRLPVDLAAAMRVAGLTHVTAVSGAHFAIIGATVLALSGFAGVPRRARVPLLAAAMAGLLLLVHPEPSVLRAAAMGAVGAGGLLLGRQARALAALGATVVVLLVVNPWLARSFGFALSVLATAGIVLLTVPVVRALARVLPERVGYALAVPLAAQSACAPVIILLNPALATYAVPANVAVAPALAPATVLGVLAAVVTPWWPAAGARLADLAGWAAWWIAEVARVSAGLPAAQLPWPGGLGGAALLAAVTVTVGLALLNRGRRRARTHQPPLGPAAREPGPAGARPAGG